MNISRRHLMCGLLAAALPLPQALAARPALPLLGVWNPAADPARWLVSEKYDGVRGVWDGSTLRFRSGRVVQAPGWFTERLPRAPLDGELWLGRGRFDELSGIVRKELPQDDEWRQVQYLVFELPDAPGTFAERAAAINTLVRQTGWAPLRAVEQQLVTDRSALQRRLADVVARGGEGLALHLASAPYGTGRSEVLLKFKPHLDAEARVVGYRPGQGKYRGQVGALRLERPDGQRFFVGSGLSDALRRDPPPVGSMVTYRYRELTSTGVPRFAAFLRLHEPV